MFHRPLRSTPLVCDISDVRLRVPVRRADAELTRDLDLRLPGLRIQ